MAPGLIQRARASSLASATLTLALPAPPTPGNLLLATTGGDQTSWSSPTGIQTGAANGPWNHTTPATGNLTLAIFAKTVSTADVVSFASGYTFTETLSVAADGVEMELEEWGGFPPGDWAVNLVGPDVENPINGTFANTTNPGSTTAAVCLVKVVVGVGGSTANTPTWNQGITVDSTFTDFTNSNQMATGHVITAAPKSFNPTTVSWLTANNSNSALFVAFTTLFLPPHASRYNQAVTRAGFGN